MRVGCEFYASVLPDSSGQQLAEMMKEEVIVSFPPVMKQEKSDV